MKFAHSFPVEHCIKRSDLVYIHFVDLGDLGYLPHSVEGQEIVVLFLSEVKKWDNCRSFPVGGEFGQYFAYLGIVLLCEIEGGGVVIVLSGSMREISGRKAKDVSLQRGEQILANSIHLNIN